MGRIETAREQADLLRRLAMSFDSPQIKQDLLGLAERCNRLAAKFSRGLAEQQMRPVAKTGESAGSFSTMRWPTRSSRSN
jgi:hypothetical protein